MCLHACVHECVHVCVHLLTFSGPGVRAALDPLGFFVGVSLGKTL